MDNSDIEKLYNEANVKQLVHDMDIVITPEQESIVRWAYTCFKYNPEFWKEAKCRYLWRGLNRAIDTPTLITPRQQRKPKTTDSWIHNILNEYFSKKYGFPFRNGVFATGDYRLAKTYVGASIKDAGLVGVIPSEGFEYLWNPELEDYYVDLKTHIQKYIQDNITDIRNTLEYLYKKYNIDANKTRLHDGPIANDIIIYALVFLEGGGRYKISGISEFDNFRKRVIIKTLNMLDATTLHNEKLAAALDSGNEIMLKCDQYLAVPHAIPLSIVFHHTIKYLAQCD